MSHTRREFLVAAAGGGVAATALGARLAAAAEKEAPKIRLSACDWSLRARGKLDAFDIAKRVGLDGVEVSAGNPADKLALADPKVRQQYKDKVKGTGVVVSSTAMGLLNGCPLASDGRAPPGSSRPSRPRKTSARRTPSSLSSARAICARARP